MKENELKSAQDEQDARLRERALLARAVPGDRLMLADATLLAALDGSRVLTPNERQALSASPLTLRRFRQLSLERQASGRSPQAANDPVWSGSGGMLRAAASAAALESLVTDDGCWTLHFLPQGEGWQVILSLSAEAPFAARLLREHVMVRVIDGGGAIVLQGRLDLDGECECGWPFATAPARHFQMYGAGFAVEPVTP
ncbi:hypothetical protein D0T25_10015 [Duganella sp. BJB488]|nr:hypothetical protein [Duganella sp. BJB1802]RFP21584.1 hypothetical protein D0T26_10055 [Duganella sp. BJB489]RFP23377.1 hypothetical protein D0T25_10015 [Duganella sp. BJB488]RFP38543.1 hypothetical protein D0T24_02860 [Duganella sp. BJB480]